MIFDAKITFEPNFQNMSISSIVVPVVLCVVKKRFIQNTIHSNLRMYGLRRPLNYLVSRSSIFLGLALPLIRQPLMFCFFIYPFK